MVIFKIENFDQNLLKFAYIYKSDKITYILKIGKIFFFLLLFFFLLQEISRNSREQRKKERKKIPCLHNILNIIGTRFM